MSLLLDAEIACSYCQYPNEVEVWSAINVKTDPELKDLLLGGEINMAECSSCKKIFYAEHFVLYNDPDSELMAFVYPRSYSEDRERWEQKTTEDFGLSQASLAETDQLKYPPVTLFGLDELVSLVEKEDEQVIQAEIVTHLATENKYQVKTISRSLARGQNMPPVIPFEGDSLTRPSVLAALAKIHAANERLFVYTEMERALTQNPHWSLSAE